ncbi:hypothetical protein ACLKA6_016723 [Drosophila palustris]
MSQQQSISSKRQPKRLPFHPRRSSRKPRLELAADATTLSDVLELTTSPISVPAVQVGLTPPPTASPGSACEDQQAEQQAEQQKQQQKRQAKRQKRQAEQQKLQAEPQAKRQEQQPAQQQQPTARPTALPMVQLPSQTTALHMAQLIARLKAAKRNTPVPPVRPLTPTTIVISDDEEPVRARYDPVVRREVPMTPGRGLTLAERPPPPPGLKPFEELVGVAWPHEVKQAARSLNPRKRRWYGVEASDIS